MMVTSEPPPHQPVFETTVNSCVIVMLLFVRYTYATFEGLAMQYKPV